MILWSLVRVFVFNFLVQWYPGLQMRHIVMCKLYPDPHLWYLLSNASYGTVLVSLLGCTKLWSVISLNSIHKLLLTRNFLPSPFIIFCSFCYFYYTAYLFTLINMYYRLSHQSLEARISTLVAKTTDGKRRSFDRNRSTGINIVLYSQHKNNHWQ